MLTSSIRYAFCLCTHTHTANPLTNMFSMNWLMTLIYFVLWFFLPIQRTFVASVAPSPQPMSPNCGQGIHRTLLSSCPTPQEWYGPQTSVLQHLGHLSVPWGCFSVLRPHHVWRHARMLASSVSLPSSLSLTTWRPSMGEDFKENAVFKIS